MPTKKRSRQQKKNDDAFNGSVFPLAVEVNTFESHLPGWLDREGQFVLITGRDVVGFYERRDEALEAGYDRFGAGPFLVKEIRAHEPMYHLPHVEL